MFGFVVAYRVKIGADDEQKDGRSKDKRFFSAVSTLQCMVINCQP